MAQLNFDSTAVEPTAGFDPIPAGQYSAQITNSEMKPTKNGQGKYLELTFTVMGGGYENRLLWLRLTLHHANQQTVEIAQGNLSAICRAIGLAQIQDSQQLHGRPMEIRVIQKDSPGYGMQNDIKGFKAIQGQAMPGQPAPQAMPPTTVMSQGQVVAQVPAQAPATQIPANGPQFNQPPAGQQGWGSR